MSGTEATFQHLIQRVLHAGQALGGVVVLVVDVDIVVAHSLTCFLAQQVVVDKGLGAFAGKFHHHARRGVGVHVGVLAGDVVVLGVDDFKEDVAGLGLACHTAFVAIVDVAACHLLARTLHQLNFDHVLDLFNGHLLAATAAYAVGNALDQALVLSGIGL